MSHLLRKYRAIPLLAMAVWVGVTFSHCGSSDDEEKRKGQSTITVFEKPEVDTTKPVWLAPSRAWPDTLHWTLDSTGRVTTDGLYLRMVTTARQVFPGGAPPVENPLHCQVLMTLRPIPQWIYAQGLKFDSLVFIDPVRSTRLPAMPILSGRRVFEDATVRAEFGNNAAVIVSPELTEGQLLDPTLYLTWDRRTLIIDGPPVPVLFITSMKKPAQKLPDWGEIQ